MRPAALRGHVSVGTVGSAGAGATRTQPLISLTVTGAHPKNVAAAANELANIVVDQTTATYVSTKIKTFQPTLDERREAAERITEQLNGSQRRWRPRRQKNLDPFQKLVIVGQQNNAETRQGNLIAQQETLQQQLALREEGRGAQVVERAASVKTSAHSRSSSVVIGALIGLIVGRSSRSPARTLPARA